MIPPTQQTEWRVVVDHFSSLRSLECLTAVSDSAVSWISERVHLREFDPGDRLIDQGDTSRDCYFIIQGQTEVRRDGVVLGVSGVGEPEGELGLFLRTPRAASTSALTRVATLVLQAEDWDELCDTQPALAEELRVGVCRHLAKRFGLPSFAGVEIGAG
jgi:CRP-like cAMP-binding protein